jgi:hypothetical protein
MKAPNNDKKKVIMLSAMGVVLLSVGAFQFIGGSTPAAPEKPKEAASEAALAQTDAAAQTKSDNIFAGAPLAQRDPFAPQVAAKVDPNAAVAQSKPEPTPTGLDPMRVPDPPMPPMPGDAGTLPQPSNYPGENAGNPAANEGAGPSFRLSGVVIGDRSVALIQVEGGKQKAVKVGDVVSGQTVASISRRGVVLVGNGQRTTLSLKGNAEIN